MATIDGFMGLQKTLQGIKKQAKLQSEPRVAVGYTAKYAIYVHESVGMKMKGKPRPRRRGKYWDPQGQAQAKFLEEPARSMQGELARIITKVMQKTGNMRSALLTAGFRLQRESQKKCPVNTGNLKNSAFTRVENI